MALYILDNLLRRKTYIEKFESLIWTERFSAFGDFQLTIRSSSTTRAQFKKETWLSYSESHRVMIVKTVEDSVDDSGKAILKVSGYSIESILRDRVAMGTLLGLSTNPKWTLTGTPANIVREIFNSICKDGLLSSNDIIPFLVPGTFYAPDTLPEMGGSTTLDLDPDTVYNTIKKICDTNDLGFRLVRHRHHDNSELFFNVYSGSDRTSAQTLIDPVIFSPALDNLNKVTELSSTAPYKNVAYVYGLHGSAIIRATETAGGTDGFDRHILFVKADDIDLPVGDALGDALTRRGHEALAESREINAFDGEISQDGKYKYVVDYDLGDLVEMSNSDGVTKKLRVTEQIFVEDPQGKRSYPTLSDLAYITPGSWYGWDYTHVWDDETVYTWGDLEGLS